MSKDARKILRENLTQRNELKATIENLSKSIISAEKVLSEATDAVAGFADLDATITSFRVNAVKSGEDPRRLPAELKAQIDCRKEAEAEREYAEATLESLKVEMLASQAVFRQLEPQRERLAAAVLQEVAEQLVNDLIALNARRECMVRVIKGLAEVSILVEGGARRFLGFSDRAAAAVNLHVDDPALTSWPGAVNRERVDARRWEERLQLLLSDPDAEISIPRPVHPSEMINLVSPPGNAFMAVATAFDLKPEE